MSELYPPEDVYEDAFDCERCVDFRKNLKCCSGLDSLMVTVHEVQSDISNMADEIRDLVDEVRDMKRRISDLEHI